MTHIPLGNGTGPVHETRSDYARFCMLPSVWNRRVQVRLDLWPRIDRRPWRKPRTLSPDDSATSPGVTDTRANQTNYKTNLNLWRPLSPVHWVQLWSIIY